ncbi:hypothetical protein ZWY2020_016985 [Hordeum vulgare]|nr:hypothetical protein ZWY2020_016985 [Hordeum vulgare]
MMCINCGCAGHFCLECETPPRCPMTLAYLGYGTERGSFYFVDVEVEEVAAELAAYIGDFRDSEFAWEVIETGPLVFSVPFPSVVLLRVCSHDLIRCPINKFLLSVHAAAAEPDPVSPMEKVWVLAYGLPRGGRSAPRVGKLAHILKAICEPMGKLVTAYLASFEDDGPVRIEILCPAPAEIDGLSLIFYFGHLRICSGRPLLPLCLALIAKIGMGARLRRAPSVRRMMLISWFLQLRLLAGVARFLLPLTLPVLPGQLLGWRQGFCQWPWPALPLS